MPMVFVLSYNRGNSVPQQLARWLRSDPPDFTRLPRCGEESSMSMMLARSTARALLAKRYVLFFGSARWTLSSGCVGRGVISFQRMSSWRYSMLTGKTCNSSLVMKTPGTVETGGSSSHMCAAVGDVSCFCHLPVYICTCYLLRAGPRGQPC